ncbi:T9SS type A sorting domain-containing protein, partial [bacterium]|nr:T9SS type A sorting domain-containing protein [bacterium]
WSAAWLFTIIEPLAVPSLVSPLNDSQISNKKPSFTWNTVSAATAYEIQVDNSNTFFSPEINTTIATSNYSASSELIAATYYWRVRCANSSGTSDWSSAWNFTIKGDPVYLTCFVNEHALHTAFYVDIQVQEAENLFGVAFQLNFPADKLEALVAEQGYFLGTDIVFYPDINNTQGTVYVGITKKGSQSGANGSGTVARIQLQEKAATPAGVSITLTLSEITANDPAGNSIVLTPQSISYTTQAKPNTAPAPPILMTPICHSNPGTTQPVLVWQIPADEENDLLHFRLEIARDSNFTESIFGSPFDSQTNGGYFSPLPPVAAGNGNCGFTVPYPLSNNQYFWRVTAWDGMVYGSTSEVWDFIVGPTGVEIPEDQLLTELELAAIYPNPFNPITMVRYVLPKSTLVTIQIFDIAGRRVKSLASGHQAAGAHQVTWQATDDQGHRVSTGIYLCRMVAGDEVRHRKMVFAK